MQPRDLVTHTLPRFDEKEKEIARVYNVFYSTVCHVCKSVPTCPEKMQFCSGCRLVQYCSHSHQKKDWLNHKELCQTVQHIVKKTGADHLFKDASLRDLCSWNKLRASIMKLVELIVKRSLTTVESQTLLFPPVCHYCFRYQAHTMSLCGSCNAVMYCCSEHERSDVEHKINCAELGLARKLDLLQFFQHNIVSNHAMYINEIFVLKELPQNMESLKIIVRKISIEEFVIYSELLSYTLSLIFAIKKLNLLISNQFIIHIVGADSMEISAVESFTLFFNLLPRIVHLKIVMIGPNMSNLLCSQVAKKNCEVHHVNKLYHEYVASECYAHPNVIAVFNGGFCEYSDVPEKDIWKLSLPCIANVYNSAVVLTSYTNHEADADLKRLCVMRNRQPTFDKVLECQINPFSSMYPRRDWERHGGLFYVNQYISILKM